MTFTKRWKTKWELKSLTFDELFNVVTKLILKQLYEFENRNILLEDNLCTEHEADSVDIVAILLNLEDIFQNISPTTRTVVPTTKLPEVVLVEDMLDIIYEVLVDIENKMEVFVPFKPNMSLLENYQKVGALYPVE